MKPGLKYIEAREAKPRNQGLTIVQDNGLSKAAVKNMLETGASVIDFVRLAATHLVMDGEIADKVQLYKDAGVEVFLDGILFEAFYIRKETEQYKGLLKKCGITCVEISDRLVIIAPAEKAAIVDNFNETFRVISRVGPLDNKVAFPMVLWNQYIDAELAAGSEKVIIEGGEAGTSHKVQGKAQPNKVLINEITSVQKQEKIVWEACDLVMQSWFVRQFGAGVNLSGVCTSGVLKLETLRLGLHPDTFFRNLPNDLTEGKLRKRDPMRDFDWQI